MSPLLTRCATLLTAAALTGAGVAAHAVLQDDPTVGAPTLGDTYTPTNGNGGIDLQHTALNLSYDPPNASTRSVLGGRMRAGTAYPVARQTTPAPTPAPTTPPKQAHLWGSATLTIKATQELSKFHLDLYDNVKPLKVTIDGRDAAFTHAAKKLAITPSARINPGQTFTAEVTYDCVWAYTNDQDSGSGGFNVTEGGVIVASQPVGSPAWFPTNDHPTDKGTYTVTMSVPKGLTVAGNGLPTQPVTTGNRTSFTWKASDPMASYLVTMCVGPYELITSSGPRGLPIINAIDKRIPAERRAQIDAELAQVPAMIELFESKWGPYPFEAYGHIIDTLDLGFALETQTRSVISARMSTPTVIAHELTHQWFGNSTSVQRWQDIWTNEGFATWGSWEWLDSGKATTSPRIPAGQQFNTVMTRGDDAFWSVIIGDPGRKNLFNRAVYNRGGATLYALRAKVGVEKFDTLMKNYVAATKGGNARVEDFEAWAAKSSGVDLAPFFTEWLRTGKKPAYTPAPETRGPAGVALPVEQPAHRGLQ